MGSLKIKLIPIIILLSGPPAFRKTENTNNTLTPEVDIWIIIQIIAYLVAFFLMLTHINKQFKFKKNIFDYLIFANFFSLFVSCILSNDIVTSAAYTFLYFIGVYFYYYSKNYYFDINEQSIVYVYILIRNIFSILLLLVAFFYIFTEGYVISGLRISGGRIANVLIICPIIFLISCFIYSTKYNNLLNKICIVSSLFFLFFAYSRSTWWSTLFLTFFLFIKLYFFNSSNSKNVNIKFFFHFLVFSLIIIMILYFSEIMNFLTRGQDDVFHLSGRDIIAEWVFSYMSENFFGLGAGTGFKRIFPTLIYYFDPLEMDPRNIGTAHNAYLEIFVSGGWISFVSYTLLSVFPLIFFIKNFKKILKSNFYLLFLLFVLVISNNMVNATSTMPSYLAFSYSWLILALINIYIYSKK
tara:strand:+ start:1434 stop:2666 length:1233 start_codon:yes stop_codon:yes gene_type:complete